MAKRILFIAANGLAAHALSAWPINGRAAPRLALSAIPMEWRVSYGF